MSEINEYVIHARIKNNLILKRILEVAPNVAQFCEANELPVSLIGELVNFKRPAMKRNGEWSKLALDLAVALGVLPDELFTDEQRVAEVRSNEAFIEMSREQALSLADPMEVLEAKELVERLLSDTKLKAQERCVLRLRFEEDRTNEEVAGLLSVSNARVRQLAANGLRKCRDTAWRTGMFELEAPAPRFGGRHDDAGQVGMQGDG